MYADFDDPWGQTALEQFATDKAIALNLLARLKAERGIMRVLELGCGLGNFTSRIAQTGLSAVGVDVSETAITKAKARHRNAEFIVGSIADHALVRRVAPDVIVMAEISWYVLEQLPAFIEFFKRDLPDIYLIHLLATYAPGVQQYGRQYFTNLDEIKRYFGFEYFESGIVHCNDGDFRTWFLGRPPGPVLGPV